MSISTLLGSFTSGDCIRFYADSILCSGKILSGWPDYSSANRRSWLPIDPSVVTIRYDYSAYLSTSTPGSGYSRAAGISSPFISFIFTLDRPTIQNKFLLLFKVQ